MFELFKSNGNFCEASILPWIIIVICSCFIILGWGIYQYGSEPDIFLENLNKRMPEDARILTNFVPSQQPYQLPAQQQAPSQHNRQQPAYPAVKSRLSAGNSLHSFEDTFKQAIAAIHPSVVNIKSLRRNGQPNRNGSYESIGSGIIVSTHGHILTNYHVIANSDNIFVTVHGIGQRTYNAWVFDHHVDTDLTLLKLETDDMFTPAVMGDSGLVETGDIVLTIGSPFGMEQTVTSGIVSGLRKTITIEGFTYENMIQTDAPINRGSSGGPLINIDGEVIGINTAIYAPTGVFSGTAFAMPINRIKRFLFSHNIVTNQQYIQTGFTAPPVNTAPSVNTAPPVNNQGWLGVEIQQVDQATAIHLGLPYIGGVLVNRVTSNSPASKEKLKRGDVILEIDGKKIEDINDFEEMMALRKPKEEVTLLLFSNKKLKECFVTLSQFSG